MAIVEAEIVEGGRWKFAANYDIIIDGCLPRELTLEILLRLPVKSLVNFKLVCKSWNYLISSPDFIKSRTRSSNNPTLTLLYDRYCMQLYSLNPTVSRENLSFHNNEPKFYELIGSCDGLICMYSPLEECIYIFNPLTKETKKISTPYHKPARCFLEIEGVSWFGLIPSINDYKIWLVVRIPKLNLRIHVYSMRDDNWRELDTISAFRFIDDARILFWGMNAVEKNETLHCSFEYDYNEFMVKYDLVQDIIELERINLNHNQDIKYKNKPSIGILKDSSLCICKVHALKGVMDVWKLDQYSNSDSWNKLFRLDLGLLQAPWVFLLGFISNGRILVRSSSDELVLVDLDQNPPLQVRLGTLVNKNNSLFDLLDYSESLVSPFSLP
ncbi:F-box/kelch-repeat protein At3g23880-like [Spinacia oleracea]|uniref:F-box/kelch-repeat protein At3g23880-like n=1 Tax=Spinacia oleracea TaxID=3562 RepID=A0ABM3REB1_SPIOL|nr:F-box/kelch-repeat protein At3g23880-like [Spinacia oleracea]